MTEPRHNQRRDISMSEIVEHHGLTIRLQPPALEWMAVITGLDQRSEIVLAAGREAEIAMAHQWIDLKTETDKEVQ
jgi:hypothetical protein